MDFGDLLVEIVLAEQRLLALEQLQAMNVAGHDQLQKLLGPLVRRRFVDVNGVDLRGDDVADGADDHVAFFVDARRRRELLNAAGDHFPQAEQVGHVARELAFGAVAAGGADDEAHALRRIQFEHDVAQPAADVLVLDLPRDADAAQRGHEHQIAAGNADVRRERRPLRADAFLDDLHEHFVAAAEDFLDRRLEARPAAETVILVRLGPRGSSSAPSELVADDRIGGMLRRTTRTGGPERLRRIETALAEILRLDVADVQKAVAAHAEIDERRLDARLQVDHDAFIDVSYVIVLPGPFYIQFFQGSVLNDRDPAFFRLRDVDQHFLFHLVAFLFGNTDQDAFVRVARPSWPCFLHGLEARATGRGEHSSGGGSCADLHGGAAQMRSLPLDAR